MEELTLGTEPLRRLAAIVRGADTARLDLAPEAAGLLAASLGLSRMYADDLAQLDAGMLLYDAFWCRDAADETHNWPTNKPKPGGRRRLIRGLQTNSPIRRIRPDCAACREAARKIVWRPRE